MYGEEVTFLCLEVQPTVHITNMKWNNNYRYWNYKLQCGDNGIETRWVLKIHLIRFLKECGQKISMENMVTMSMLRNPNTNITIKVNTVIKDVEKFIFLFFELKYSEGNVDW